MAFRLSGIRPVIISSGNNSNVEYLTLRVPSPYKSITEALNKVKEHSVIEIHSGEYLEDLVIPDKVDLLGIGNVIINGNVKVNGDGNLENLTINGVLTIENGKRGITGCSVKYKISLVKASAKIKDLQLDGHLDLKDSQLILQESTISAKMDNSVMAERSVILVDDCALEGPVWISDKTFVECKSTTLMEHMKVDLIVVKDVGSSIQLFNCYASGSKHIKSGPGNSVRSNLIALGSATELIGGENLKVEDV